MRSVIVHGPDENVRDLRRVLHGAGFECDKADCVVWNELAKRLTGKPVQLLVVRLNSGDAVDNESLREAWPLVKARKVAVIPPTDDEVAAKARELGISDNDLVLDTDVENSFHEVLDRIRRQASTNDAPGTVISVVAPCPGSGGTTVAANLAGSLSRRLGSQQQPAIALLEICREPGDLALLLNVDPEHPADEVCGNWRDLDLVGFNTSLEKHAMGVSVLANSVDGAGNAQLSADSARRILILSRLSHAVTIVALDSMPSEASLEAMRLSDRVLMVTRPDVPSVRRVRWAVGQAAEGGVERERIDLVVNRWGQPGQLGRDKIEFSVGLEPLEYIPDERGKVNRAANEGKFLRELGGGRITRKFDALANKLLKIAAAAKD